MIKMSGMDAETRLTERFEAERTRLRAVAYRMLGSLSEADDAVQEAWLRLRRSDTSRDRQPRRLADHRRRTGLPWTCCARGSRGARSRSAPTCPSRSSAREDRRDPEQQALLADSVGLALLVVLEQLAPAERLGLRAPRHVRRPVRGDRVRSSSARRPRPASSPAAPAVACGARRPRPTPIRARQREVVDAFLAAARDGDFDALLAVLDPDVVLRADGGVARAGVVARGARRRRRSRGRRSASGGWRASARRALVNGDAGLVALPGDEPFAVIGFTIADGRIVEIDILADPERLRRLDVTVLDA